MLDIIALGDNVIVARDDAAGLVELALGVQRPGRRHATEDVGIAASQLVGADADERAWQLVNTSLTGTQYGSRSNSPGWGAETHVAVTRVWLHKE